MDGWKPMNCPFAFETNADGQYAVEIGKARAGARKKVSVAESKPKEWLMKGGKGGVLGRNTRRCVVRLWCGRRKKGVICFGRGGEVGVRRWQHSAQAFTGAGNSTMTLDTLTLTTGRGDRGTAGKTDRGQSDPLSG